MGWVALGADSGGPDMGASREGDQSTSEASCTYIWIGLYLRSLGIHHGIDDHLYVHIISNVHFLP